MKYFLAMMVLLALCVPALAEDFEVTEAQYVVVGGSITDTLGRVNLTPDSIRITVADSAGTELYDAWFNNADAQCTLNGDVITFHDQWEDINGAANIGIFHIVAVVASVHNTTKVYSNYNYTLRGLTTATEATQDVNIISVNGDATAATNLDTFYDDTGAQFTNFDDMYDNTGYAGGTTRLITSANITAISDDAAAAESLEVALDGGIPTLSERLSGIADTTGVTFDTANATIIITQSTLDAVNAIALAGTNISTIAEADELTDGIETNTYVATHIHDETYYQVAESDGVVGTNLNINTYIQFDVGADAKPVHIVYIARLDEGSAPSGGDTLHVWVYDWSGSSWTHINPPGEDLVGVFNSDSGDDAIFEIQLIDPNYVSNDSGKVRIAFSNYDPDGATANDLEENTELYLDFAFIEYQSVLTAAIIADASAAYPSYTWKMVAKAGATTIQFAVSYIIDGEGNSPGTAANDFCLGMAVQAQDGNSNAKAVTIADFTLADSTFTVRPAFASAPTAGDTIFIRPWRGAVEPSVWTQPEILLSATGKVRADSVETRVTSLLDSVVTNAMTELAISAGFSLEQQKYIWANIDTSAFPTDSSDFMAYLTNRFSSSVTLPDSVSDMVTTLDQAYVDLLFIKGYTDLEIAELVATLDSVLTSLGYDGANSAHTKIDALSLSGGGSEPETLIVKAAADSSLIQGARITVRTLDQSTVKVPGLTTDVNGKRILELDADSFYVAVTANNYVQKTDTIAVASGGQTDIIYMTLFDPGSPAAENETRVWGYIYQNVANAHITASIPQDFWPIYYEDEAMVARKTANSDGTGYWYIDLVPNSLTSDTESVWEFTGKVGSETILGPCQKEVLDTTSQELTDCEP